MATPCYSGPNPVKDNERLGIWKWAKENGIDQGVPLEQVSKAINDHFFGGQAKPEWINDILSGRKTPFKSVATDMWKKQYNRRLITQQATEISKLGAMGKVGKTLRFLWTLPRSVAVAGHGIVFPITHAGDLAFRPTNWGTLISGALRTYRGALVPSKLGGGKAYTARILSRVASEKLPSDLQGIVNGDSFSDFGIRSGVDMGPKSKPSGLISRTYKGPAQRAWDMLTVMRYYLWKREVLKYLKPGMSEAEALDIGSSLATWANHATGSANIGTGGMARAASELAFGPKLTASKVARITGDPAATIKTFANWDAATLGERAVAMTRLSGATQFLVTNIGFLGVNAGLLYALHQKEKINTTDPFKSDFLGFKGNGIEGNVPGLHSEIKALAQVLAISIASKNPRTWTPQKIAQLQRQYHTELRGDTKFAAIAKTGGRYVMGKLAPTYQRVLEATTGENYRGQPLPGAFSSEPGTPARPKLTYAEYAADIGPIPTSGPTGYVFDQLEKTGMSKADSLATLKALIITGLSDPKTWELGALGLPGFHVREEYVTKPKQSVSAKVYR